MKKLFSLIVVTFFATQILQAQVAVTNLLTENLSAPISIDVATPRFSWLLATSEKNVLQNAYEIKVTNGKTAVWNSGKVLSNQSVFIPYGGTQLQSGQQYFWQVRVWDNHNNTSGWSKLASFKMGMLNPADWKAKWIESSFAEDSINRPAQYFRKPFLLSKKIKNATAYITAHGAYEAQINGKRVGDYYLTPGWTSYNNRLQYQVYDVTAMLTNGVNVAGIVTGMGWYRGYLAWDNHKNIYGKKTGVLFQMAIEYTDGSKEYIVSDENWTSSYGAIKYSEIYNGEIIDARAEKTGWATANFNDADWSKVNIGAVDKANLVATYNEPIKKHETFKPIKIFKTPKGDLVADFGQNLVGWVELNVKGNSGDKVDIYHAEVLDKDGNFYTDNLRVAKQQNTYILKGGGAEFFEPHFTFQGFRYIKVTGFPGELKPENITAVALYSDMKPTGTFTSSNALVNQLQHNIQWDKEVIF